MKTKFTPLVGIKKNELKKSELALAQANINLQNAQVKLQNSYEQLEHLPSLTKGSGADMLKARALYKAQRGMIDKDKEWLEFAKTQAILATQKLQRDTLEYEKFSHLENELIKELLKEQKKAESKNLDEIALLKYKGKRL